MNSSISDAVAELIAMRASGEITPEEFQAARARLRGESPPSSSDAPLPFSTNFSSASAQGIAPPAPAIAPPPIPTAAAKKKPSKLSQAFGIAVLLVIAIVVIGSPGGKSVYKQADYGSSWPYPGFDTAVVRCQMKTFGSTDRPVATVELGSVTYGLNGAALGIGKYPDPRPLESSDKGAIASTVSKMIDDAVVNLCHVRQ